MSIDSAIIYAAEIIGQAVTATDPGDEAAIKNILLGFKEMNETCASLTNLSLTVLGASLYVILNKDIPKPIIKDAKTFYFILVPAWILIAASMFLGNEIHSHYVNAIGNPGNSIPVFSNASLLFKWQGYLFVSGVGTLALWLISYLFWWYYN